MKYNFDQIIDRNSTYATKSYVPHIVLNHPDCSTLWVADMDFEVCKEVVEALKQRVNHPIFGYTEKTHELKDAVINWYKRRHHIIYDYDDIVLNTGVIHGYSAAIRILSNTDDEVIVPIPAYSPFLKKVLANHRKVITTKLKSANDGFAIDFNDLESKISEKTKIFVLCNPHNPTGKVYSKQELLEISKFCEKHQLRIISDEIHCDIIFHKQFYSIIDISEYAKQNSIVLCSIGKTFNLAGLKMGCAIIKNKEINKEFLLESECVGNTSINCLAEEAYKAAYNYGDEWLDQCLDYIEKNIDWTIQQFEIHFPKLDIQKPEGTYMVWIDLSSFNIDSDDIQKYFLENSNTYVTQGEFFGEEYKDYIRLNMATPKSNVQKGVESIIQTLKQL